MFKIVYLVHLFMLKFPTMEHVFAVKTDNTMKTTYESATMDYTRTKMNESSVILLEKHVIMLACAYLVILETFWLMELD